MELPLFSPALLEHARSELARGWSSQRRDTIPPEAGEEGLEMFRESTIELPFLLGRELAIALTRREEALEDARTGGVMALLETLAEGAGPVLELVRDDQRYAALFQRDVAEHFGDGAALAGELGAGQDGITLTFPAGVFKMPDVLSNWSNSKPFPRDVTIRGAGMNSTLLVGADFGARSTVRNLTLRDCTLYADRGYIFDQRRDGCVLQFDRMRVIGFDSGAGGSCCFGTRTLALRCTDSLFVAGYGRSPRHGQLFDVRTDGMVARFDGCTIEGLRIGRPRPGATLVFRGCHFIDAMENPALRAESTPGLLLDNCSVHLFQGDDANSELKKDLNDLFPGWQGALR